MQTQLYRSKHTKTCLFYTFVLGLILVFSITEKSFAQDIADSPCDANYFQSLEQRAWLEAQREITQNQNLIFKPDSVLAYTCFHGYLFELADHADEMFSENTRWGDDVLGSDQDVHMNRALEALVSRAMANYLQSNFAVGGQRRLLGHRITSPQFADPSTYTTIPNGRNYECDIMQQVWMAAKCYNFQEMEQDGFFTFEHYTTATNSRPLLSPCAGEPTSLYRTAIDRAGLNPDADPAWPRDNTLTYIRNFDAASCGDDDFPPIATGVTVRRQHQDPREYFEGVCIQPGCMYQPSGGGGGTPTASGSCVP
ncbi:MAG: hypothetical protein ACK4VI_02230 [Alphaproteobacteria bacterium]